MSHYYVEKFKDSFRHFLNCVDYVVLNKMAVNGELEKVWKEIWLKD
jgi:hypothetical protein